MNEETKPRVLVIDDEESIRTWLRGLLVSLGCEVVGAAENGQEGVELFKKERPDLVLLDMKMPVMGGDKALEWIMLEDPDARVVLLTSVNESRFIFERMMAGAQYYLRKDSPTDEIRAALQEQIDKLKTSGGDGST